jgi:hypothetical protein
MAETVLVNFTTLEKSNDDKSKDDKSKDDKSTQMEQARLEFANIYTELPPCVRKDINARIDRKKLDCGSPEAMKIITHCRDQYIKKRDYNRQLGATVRNLAKSAKASPEKLKEQAEPCSPKCETLESQVESECSTLEKQSDDQAAESKCEPSEYNLDAILSEPKKEIPPQSGVPRTTARQINTVIAQKGVSKLFKSPDKLRRS